MSQVNKKLWSFIFGCLIAGSFVWLISFGNTASIPLFLEPYPDFIIDYYAFSVTAIASILLTLIAVLIMGQAFKVCSSDHPFWLALPTIIFVFLTFFASKLMLASMLSAALPTLLVLAILAIIFRVFKVKNVKVNEASH